MHYEAMAFRPDARRLAMSAHNGDLTLWDTGDPARPERAGRLRQERGIVAATWHPADPGLLATAASDGAGAVWRLPGDGAPERLTRWATPAARPRYAGWGGNGRWVWTMTADGHTVVHDIHAGTLAGQADLGGGRHVVAAHTRGDHVVAVVDAGWAHLWDPRDAPGRWLRLTGRQTTASAWNGTLLAVAGADGWITCLDADFHQVGVLRLERRPTALAFAGTGVVVARLTGGRVVAVDLDGTVRWEDGPGVTGIEVAGELVAMTTGTVVARPRLLSLGSGHQALAHGG